MKCQLETTNASMMQLLKPPSALSGRSTYRRRYKKSTLGCDACKSRKIKCDETRPVCGNCKRYYTDASACQYGKQSRPSKAAVPTPQSTVVSVRPATLESTNILALRLMHHYTLTFDVNQPLNLSNKDLLARNLWKVQIPSIAFTSEPVLNALLGISAWHLWSLNPEDEQLITVSRVYFGKALNTQRLALQQSDAKGLPPVFIAGIILAHLSWLLTHSDERADMQSFALGTFHLCTGFRSLTTKVSGDWSKFAFLGLESAMATPIQPSKYEKFMTQAAQDSEYLFDRIMNAGIDRESKEAYRQVFRELWRMYTIVTDDCVDVTTKEHTVVNHLHRVPASFVRLLGHKEPLALALLARAHALLALLRNISTAWYIHGAGKFPMYIHTVRSIPKLLTPEWMWIMDWPERLISDEFTTTLDRYEGDVRK